MVVKGKGEIMKYLGKRRLYQIAKQLLQEKLCGERDCFYKKYRGSEWLRFRSADSEYSFELYAMKEGKFLRLEKKAWNECTDDWDICQERTVVNGFGKIGIAI